MNEKLKDLTLEEKASLMSGANFWNTKAIERLDIPSIMLTDGPHGLRKQGGKADHLGLHKSIPATAYPTAATLANSWDRELLYKVGKHLGEESAYHDVSVLLGPGINIKRNPLCGRNFEYFSEDPYLSGILASEMIKGIQESNVSACVKHFAVNSQEHIRMSINEIVDKRALHEIYLEAFRIAISNGDVGAVMTSYNKVNGIFANEHPYLLKDILREKWNFKGLVVTDWGGNNDRVKALKVFNQLEMPSSNGMTDKDIVDAIKNGELDESILNENVSSFLDFVDKHKDLKKTVYDIGLFHAKAIEAAKKSIVLLKNENKLLPLKKEQTFALIGDFVKTPRYQGAGSSLINPTKITSLYDALEGYKFEYAKGYHRYGKEKSNLLKEALDVVSHNDIVIVSIGLDESREAEVVDRDNMKLSDNQIQLINELYKLNKKIIVLLSGGSPIEMPFIDKVDAIVHGYLGGQGSGEAMRQVLFGEYNPSGKLAESYPLKYQDVVSSSYYPGKVKVSEHRESIFIGYRQLDYLNQDVLFEFGYGLSYSDFQLANLRYDSRLYVDVENVSDIDGETIIQVYISKKTSNILREKSKLAGFLKVNLKAKEKKTVEIEIYDHAFKHYDIDSDDWVVEKGSYIINVGFSSRDFRESLEIFKEGRSYSKNIPKSYLPENLMNISKESFEEFLEFKIDDDIYDNNQPLTYNSIILETKYHSNFGKFINGIIDLLHNSLKKAGKPIAANNIIFAQNLPFRGLARMSNGILNMDNLDGLIMMFDKKFYKGFKKFISGYGRKK